MLFDVLGLGWATWPEFWATHNRSDLMFVTQSVEDALWGAPDQLIEQLLEDMQLLIDALKLNITIPIAQFAAAPGFFSNITDVHTALTTQGYITMYTGAQTVDCVVLKVL